MSWARWSPLGPAGDRWARWRPPSVSQAVPDSIRILYTAGDLAPGVAAELQAPSCCQECRANDAPLIDDGANDARLVVHGMPFDVFETLRLAVQSSSQSTFSQRQLTPDWVYTLAMERALWRRDPEQAPTREWCGARRETRTSITIRSFATLAEIGFEGRRPES
jgi:hypothetical protein